MFWYHVPQFSVSSALSAKAYLYHKGLFYHLCFCKLLLKNYIVIGEKIKFLEQVSLRELSESSVWLENVSVSRNVILQSLFNNLIQKGLFYYNSCHPNEPLDKKVLKCSAGWTVSEYLFAFYHYHIDEPTVSGWYLMVKMNCLISSMAFCCQYCLKWNQLKENTNWKHPCKTVTAIFVAFNHMQPVSGICEAGGNVGNRFIYFGKLVSFLHFWT